MHEVLEATERPVVERGDAHATLTEALACLDRVWEGAQFGTAVLNAAWKRRAVKLLTKLYQAWPGAAAIPRWLERDLTLEIDGIKWSGRADRIEETGPQRLRIVDYKTGTSAVSVDEASQSIQLGFYVLAADADPEIRAIGRPTEAQMWYPLSQTQKPTVRRLDSILIEGVRARMKEIATAIAAEEYEPRVSEACGRCEVRLVCPAWPEGRDAWVA
jgi:RecB family exonuclease